ncbi:ParA family protein [Rhizobium sp. TRM95796]|uniref:ParA family protein n=1 Tax=Rhizobium sp. TRM95796 TaxID=2979862 RepID=UPI0021E84098|nr:ParA family protein [Rhizobium sp. TRM95796]MCV3769066.1 ParA family protein [Rhizobium sp. TRM95796]
MNVISLVTRKGGSGKSTLAINIGVMAEQSGEQVLLLDCDEQQTLSRWAERRQSDTPFFETILNSRQLTETLTEASDRNFSTVVIDTPGFNTPIVHDVIKRSNLCLVPTRPTTADIEAMASVLLAIRAEKKQFAFVINQASSAARSAEATKGLQALGEVCPVVIGARVAFQDAIDTGRGISELQQRGKALDEFRSLWAWLRVRLNASSHRSSGMKR